MACIDLVDLGHLYASSAKAADSTQWAVKPMTMTWNDGGAYALLGPSGCGKTTVLNVISGLLTPARGKVLFDGRDVTQLAPQERNIAQVFQFPVVYDTMTVFDNLAFPLHNRKWARADIRKRVQEIAEILELSAELGKRARGLSADAKQKISLGRGLVRPDVAAVLFDEPLTVIDPHLKWLLRRKLKQIHQQLKLSLIYVTHDQTEALTFADRVVVMTQGEVVQIGTPQELFAAPAHRFVGHFIGTPGMNFLECTWGDAGPRIGATQVSTASSTAPPATAALTIGIRPEFVELADSAGPNRVPAQICSVRDQGVNTMAQLKILSPSAAPRGGGQGGGNAAGSLLWAKLRTGTPLPAHGNAFVHLPAEHCAVYADDRRLA